MQLDNTDTLDISISPDNDMLKKTYQSLGLIEEFYNTLDKFKYIINRINLSPSIVINDINDELNLIYTEYIALTETLDTNNVPIDIIRNQVLSIQTRGKIERLGIGPQIIRQRQDQRLSIEEIADFHKISVGLVKKFFITYDKYKPAKQLQIREENSVFNTTKQFERLFITIQRMLSRLESDPAIHVKYVTELRNLVNDAAKITDKQMEFMRYQDFIKGVALIMERVAPEQRDLINSGIRSLLNNPTSYDNRLTNNSTEDTYVV